MSDGNGRFDDLCARYTEPLVRELMRFGCLEQDARDVAQEALLATWKRIEWIAPGAEWIYLKTAAHRRAINRNRDEQAVIRGGGANVSLEALGGVMIDRSATAEAQLIAREEAERFRRRFDTAFAELAPESRLCLILRRRGHSPAEVAKQLGLSGTAVRSRLMRATRQLRERVGPPPHDVEWAELTGDNDDHEE